MKAGYLIFVKGGVDFIVGVLIDEDLAKTYPMVVDSREDIDDMVTTMRELLRKLADVCKDRMIFGVNEGEVGGIFHRVLEVE